jgi:hypothetical protein
MNTGIKDEPVKSGEWRVRSDEWICVAQHRGACADRAARWDGATMPVKKPVMSRKNRNIGFRPFFDCNPLRSRLLQQKWEKAVLRIIRNFLRVGYMGEGDGNYEWRVGSDESRRPSHSVAVCSSDSSTVVHVRRSGRAEKGRQSSERKSLLLGLRWVKVGQACFCK